MPDRIRVLRLYVFEGERGAVERTLAHSLQDGTHERAAWGNPRDRVDHVTMHVATIGQFPELLNKPDTVTVGHLRYLVWPQLPISAGAAEAWDRIQAEGLAGVLWYFESGGRYVLQAAEETEREATRWRRLTEAANVALEPEPDVRAPEGTPVDAGTVYDAQHEEILPGVPDAPPEHAYSFDFAKGTVTDKGPLPLDVELAEENDEMHGRTPGAMPAPPLDGRD